MLCPHVEKIFITESDFIVWTRTCYIWYLRLAKQHKVSATAAFNSVLLYSVGNIGKKNHFRRQKRGLPSNRTFPRTIYVLSILKHFAGNGKEVSSILSRFFVLWRFLFFGPEFLAIRGSLKQAGAVCEPQFPSNFNGFFSLSHIGLIGIDKPCIRFPDGLKRIYWI